MLKRGLKLYSSNRNYLAQARLLRERNRYDYIELYCLPETLAEFSPIWEPSLGPYVVHGPHTWHNLNFSVKEMRQNNLRLAQDAQRWADHLRADTIIFHPGIAGDIAETVYEMRSLSDGRIVVENKPYYLETDPRICNGCFVEEIKVVMDGVGCGFCLDMGHAVFAANAKKIPPFGLIRDFAALKPRIFHLTDGDSAGVHDSHLHLGAGSFDLRAMLGLIPEGSPVTIETIKDSQESLDDFDADVRYLEALLAEKK